MLNAVIRFSLRHRVLVLAAAVFLLAYGGWELARLPIDVFPDLNRPRVTVITEAPGMAPEEVETLITLPLETAINGATGVQAVRSSSGVGISIVRVEFDWGTDIYNDRQIVNERLAPVAAQLPPGIKPQLAPISSIMGQIMFIGLWSETGKTQPKQLRTLADWDIRPRLRRIRGVSEVFAIGGERKQFQVLVDPDKLQKFDVTLHDVHAALQQSNSNVTGGYLVKQGPEELLVRSLGRLHPTAEQAIADLKKLPVKVHVSGVRRQVILLQEVAQVIEGPEVKRGDASAFLGDGAGRFSGGPAVVLTVTKQPGADTRKVTEEIVDALDEVQESLRNSPYDDVRIYPELYQQKAFIDLAIANVEEAIRNGALLVVVILVVFLVNFRTTFITLTAIPLSVVTTALVFHWFGLSINTMTLGGLAVAIGELVDDAIVDVENIFRRLRENRLRAAPEPALRVVYRASVEVRNSIVFSTLIVVLVFVPLFALTGMEGRLFKPLGIAYIVSILSSLLVSLTVTPALSYLLLPKARAVARNRDGLLLRGLKWAAAHAIRGSLRAPVLVLVVALAAVAVSVSLLARLESDFLPPFDEGAVQLNVIMQPGTSLSESRRVAQTVENRLKEIRGLRAFVAKTGRAELDEHAVGVNVTEFVATFDSDSKRSREAVLAEIRRKMADIPDVITTVEQPLAHLISAMLSGVQAQVAIKIYGDDLDVLSGMAKAMGSAVAEVPGVQDLAVESQIRIPQRRIQLDRDWLAAQGLRPGEVNELIETAMQGKVVSQVLLEEKNVKTIQTIDLLVRLDDKSREDPEVLKRLVIELPEGGKTPLSSVATIKDDRGPNTINREHVCRRVVLQCNIAGRGMVDVVRDIQRAVRPIQQALPMGYSVEFGGQFQSQQSAARTIAILFAGSLVAVFLMLFTMFRSVNFSLQVMAALPAAFIGAVAALVLTGQTLSVSAMVGFISLAGIASRNGILLLAHYVHLVRHEGETWSAKMLIRAGQERLAPVLMTALTGGIGLVPLAMAAGEPGKEILYPVATVIIGGLISSTLLEFLVRPALFWTFGRKAGERLLRRTAADTAVDLDSAESASSPRRHGEHGERAEERQVQQV